MNPYLKRLREQYDALKSSTEGLQTRAAQENRDLSDTELTSITDQATQMRSLAEQIENLTDLETRSAAIAQLGAQIAGASDDDPDDDTHNRSGGQGSQRLGTTQTQDRDPGHYTRNSKHSFFRDMNNSKQGDERAARRLAEHNRALDTTGEGVGLVAPKWLTEEFQTIARQGRALANAVRNIPLGDDPRPMTIPKQTADTEDAVTDQTNENDALTDTDEYDTDVDTVTPRVTAGKQTVSRQMMDMASPAIDLLIYSDLVGVYNLRVEKKVGAAMVTAAGSAVTTFATEAAFTGTAPAVPGYDAVVDTGLAVWSDRKLPADIVAMGVRRWGKFKKLKDTTGRPLIPASTAGPVNVFGVGDIAVRGQIEELGVVVTEGVAGTAYPESVLVARASDTLLFESNLMRFKYEEVKGPESIVVGIWGYTAVFVKYPGKSVKRFVVTAAS